MMNVIDVSHLTKRFGSFVAVDDISFTVKRGEIFGFLGANGAGKTTAMRILCAISQPTSGLVQVAGYDVNLFSESVKKRIGYMSQKFSLYNDLTVQENLRFFGGIYGMSIPDIQAKLSILLKRFEMLDIQNTVVRSLPLGWKQKISFMAAIMHDPQIVFLDEPTSGVDPFTRRQFWEFIYEATFHGITVFVTTHYMDEAEYCHRLSIMVDGQIVAIDSPEGLKTKFGVLGMKDVFQLLAKGAKRGADL